MIKIQLSGRQYEIDKNLRKYVETKLGKLDKYMPRAHQAVAMRVEVFRDPSGREDNRYKVTAVLEVPGPDLVAETATINPHSAVDIVEAKLKDQIRRYKDKSVPKRLRIKDALGKLRQK
ncbi:ribosome-associated translation inhibitor RaiA [Candidatus Saccharibacteria bacterium]|nr:ribosome-associated translation inhibitor RaiA [Candidatus Saccharibacteria bacterium]